MATVGYSVYYYYSFFSQRVNLLRWLGYSALLQSKEVRCHRQYSLLEQIWDIKGSLGLTVSVALFIYIEDAFKYNNRIFSRSANYRLRHIVYKKISIKRNQENPRHAWFDFFFLFLLFFHCVCLFVVFFCIRCVVLEWFHCSSIELKM